MSKNKFMLVEERLPDKGRNIIGIDTDGKMRHCFRCACHNPNCMEWRSSLTGDGLIVNILKWTYAPRNEFYALIDRLQKHSEWKYPEREWTNEIYYEIAFQWMGREAELEERVIKLEKDMRDAVAL